MIFTIYFAFQQKKLFYIEMSDNNDVDAMMSRTMNNKMQIPNDFDR